MITFRNVEKSYSNDIDISRKRAMRELFWPVKKGYLEKTGREIIALKDISFNLAEGESLIVAGPPGAGKTTLARVICGLTMPDKGNADVDGKVQLVSAGRIGATPLMKLNEFVRLLLMLYGADSKSISAECEQLLEQCGMINLSTRKISELPHGIMKGMSLLISISVAADIYVFDGIPNINEPEIAKHFFDRFTEIVETRTVIIFTETPDKIPIRPDKLMEINSGRCEYFGLYSSGHRPSLKTDIKKNNIKSSQPKARVKSQSLVDTATKLMDDSARNNLAASIEHALEGDGPIIAGPYLSDVGIELLYWIPFLRWLLEARGLSGNRILAVSRCGADNWYQSLGIEYMDMCDLLGYEEFNQRLDDLRTTNMKQQEVNEFERNILDIVRGKLGIRNYRLLHPSLIFNGFLQAWKRTIPVELLLDYTKFVKYNVKHDVSKNLGLPEEFVALKLSFCRYLPENQKNREFFEKLSKMLCAKFNVIDLDMGMEVDKHRAFQLDIDGMYKMEPRAGCRDMFNHQTEVISKAQLCIGTHSNISSIAVQMGIPTLNLYSEKSSGILSLNTWVLESGIPNTTNGYYSAIDISKSSPEKIVEQVVNILKQKSVAN